MAQVRSLDEMVKTVAVDLMGVGAAELAAGATKLLHRLNEFFLPPM